MKTYDHTKLTVAELDARPKRHPPVHVLTAKTQETRYGLPNLALTIADPLLQCHPSLHIPHRYVEQLETLKSQEKSIVRNTQVVEQMYALLAQYDVKAPSEDMVQVDDLRTIQVCCVVATCIRPGSVARRTHIQASGGRDGQFSPPDCRSTFPINMLSK